MAFNGQVVNEDGKVVNMKWQEFKWKAKQKFDAAKEWCKQNKELVVAAVPALIGGAFEIIKIASKADAREEEKELKELYIYDRSMGHYWKLRRRLTNSEYREIERRKAEGESMGEILESMRVLG